MRSFRFGARTVPFWALVAGEHSASFFAEELNEPHSRYSRYPPHCSTADQMGDRAIPSLSSPRDGDDDVFLVHATVVVGHGQRAPRARSAPCWGGRRDAEARRCGLVERTTTTSSDDRSFPSVLLEKRYDAPASVSICRAGQLVREGRDQQERNGAILRDAYGPLLGDDDPRPFVRARVADAPAAFASAEALLRGLARPFLDAYNVTTTTVFEVRTADAAVDVATPNELLCPSLRRMRTEAERSVEFREFNSSAEATELRRLLRDDLGGEGWHDDARGEWQEPLDFVRECLTTTMCADEELPHGVNDYGARNEDGEKGLFERLLDFSTRKHTFHLRHNDAEYARLAMAPLWGKILSHVRPLANIRRGDDDGHYFDAMRDRGLPRLALYAGLDTTVVALLSSLGGTVYDGEEWAPYASMVVIEVHASRSEDVVSTTPLRFRLLYNGRVATGGVPGCAPSEELCDVRALFDAVYAANARPACVESELRVPHGRFGSVLERAGEMISAPGEDLLVLSCASIASAALGWFLTYAILMRKIPFRGRRGPRAVWRSTYSERGKILE